MKKFLAVLMDRNILNFVWRDLDDTFKVVGPILFCFLIFCFCKYKQQKNLFFNFVKYGMWKGGGK